MNSMLVAPVREKYEILHGIESFMKIYAAKQPLKVKELLATVKQSFNIRAPPGLTGFTALHYWLCYSHQIFMTK
jgi:hypothetical protein